MGKIRSFLLIATFIVSMAFSVTIINHCPFVIDTPGEYVVDPTGDGTADAYLRCSSPGVGILVNADAVIDYNGSEVVPSESWFNALEVGRDDVHVSILNMASPDSSIAGNGPVVLRGYVVLNNTTSHSPFLLAEGIHELQMVDARISMGVTGTPLSLCSARISHDGRSEPGLAVVCHESNRIVDYSRTPLVFIYNSTNVTVVGTHAPTGGQFGMYIVDSQNITVENGHLPLLYYDFMSGQYVGDPLCRGSRGVMFYNVSLPAFHLLNCGNVVFSNVTQRGVKTFPYTKQLLIEGGEGVILFNVSFPTLYLKNCRNVSIADSKWEPMNLYLLSLYFHTPAFQIDNCEDVHIVRTAIDVPRGIFLHDPTLVSTLELDNVTHYGLPIYLVTTPTVQERPFGQLFVRNTNLVVANVNVSLASHAIVGYRSHITIENVSMGRNESDPYGANGEGFYTLLYGRDVSVYVRNITLGNFTTIPSYGTHPVAAVHVIDGNVSIENVTFLSTGAEEVPYNSHVLTHFLFVEGSGESHLYAQGLMGSVRLPVFGVLRSVTDQCTFVGENMNLSLLEPFNATLFTLIKCSEVNLSNISAEGYMKSGWETGRPYLSEVSNGFWVDSLYLNNVNLINYAVRDGESDENGRQLSDGLDIFGDNLKVEINNSRLILPIHFMAWGAGDGNFTTYLTLDNSVIDGGNGAAIASTRRGLWVWGNNVTLRGGGVDWTYFGPFPAGRWGKVGVIHVDAETSSDALPFVLNASFENSHLYCLNSTLYSSYYGNRYLPISPSYISVANSTVVGCGLLLYGEVKNTSNETVGVTLSRYSLYFYGGSWEGPFIDVANYTIPDLDNTPYRWESVDAVFDGVTLEAAFPWAVGNIWGSDVHLAVKNVLVPWGNLSSGVGVLVDVTSLNGSLFRMENLTIYTEGINITYPNVTVVPEDEGGIYHHVLKNPFAVGEAAYIYDPPSHIYYIAINDSFETAFNTTGTIITFYVPAPEICGRMVAKWLFSFAPLEIVLSSGELREGVCNGTVYTLIG